MCGDATCSVICSWNQLPCCEEAKAAGLVRPYGAVTGPSAVPYSCGSGHMTIVNLTAMGCVPLKVDSLPPITASQLDPTSTGLSHPMTDVILGNYALGEGIITQGWITGNSPNVLGGKAA